MRDRCSLRRHLIRSAWQCCTSSHRVCDSRNELFAARSLALARVAMLRRVKSSDDGLAGHKFCAAAEKNLELFLWCMERSRNTLEWCAAQVRRAEQRASFHSCATRAEPPRKRDVRAEPSPCIARSHVKVNVAVVHSTGVYGVLNRIACGCAKRHNQQRGETSCSSKKSNE